MIVESAYAIEKSISNFRCHKADTVTWHFLRFILNRVLPLHYKFQKAQEGIPVSKYTNKEVIISLTTFPDRMNTLPIVLESLLRQTVKPSRIILWLADEQFAVHDEVYSYLATYIERGVEVRFCEDLRSHKKYFYAMKENPDALIVTADDDLIYSERMLEELIRTHIKYPDCIVCHRAHQMKVEAGRVLPYSEWNWRAAGCSGPDLYLCATSGAGCLYPPNTLSEHVFDKDILMKYCFYADDIWLKCMSFLKKTPTVLTGVNNPEIIDIGGTKKNGLARINVGQGGNDSQLLNVSKYYGIRW